MSIPIGNLVIEMAINQARMIKDIEAAKKTVDNAMASIKKSAELAAKSLGALGIGLSAGMFAEWVRGAIDAADKLNDLSKSTGLAVKQLAGLKLAAKQSGGDLDGIAASINKLSVNIGNDAKKFELIGVTAKEPLEAFKQLADVFSAIQDPQLRAALGAEALGKSWASAAPLLAEGGAKIGEMVDKGKALANITPEVAQAADQLNDTLAEISARSEGLKNQLMIALLPSLQRIADAMNETSMASKVMSLAMQGVGAIFDGIVFVGGTAINVLKAAGVGIREIVEMTAAIATGNGIDGVKAAYDKAGAALSEIVSDQVAFRESFLPKAQDDEMARLINRQSEAVKRNSAAIEENARAFLGNNAAKKEGVDLYAKMIKQADDLVASIEFETKLLTMNNVEKETAIALQKIANMGIKEGTEEYKKYSEAIIAATLDKAQVQSIIDSNKRIEEARLDAIKKADEAQKKMEEDAAKQISDIGNQVGQSFADALMNGGRNAADYLKDLFRTLILRPIVQPLISGTISGILAGAAGSAAAGGMDGMVGGAAGSTGLMGAFGSLKNIYDMATGSFASLGAAASGIAFDVASMGASAAEIAADTYAAANIAANAGEVAVAAGSAMSALGGIGAGLALGNMISGDKSVGGSSWITTGAGTAIGAVVGGPLGSAIGGAIGGAINAAFGMGKKENTDSGILGNLTSSGVGLANYQEWEQKGGWLRSGDSGADWTPADSKVTKYMNDVVAKTAITVKQYADVLGLPAKGIAEFSFEIKQSLVGLTAEEAQKQIDFLLAAYGNALASNVASEIGPFQRDGEEAGATLSRLATSLQSVNSVFDTLNITLMETSLSGADASSKLVDMFGGIDKFVSATDAYYQAFYTEQERAAKTTEQLTAVFSQLGLSMPATNDAFRAMVESARAAGNDGLFASLIKLAPAFKDLDTSLANIAQASIQAAQQAAQDAALADLDRQRTVAQAAKDAAGESVSALKSLFDYLREQVSGILQVADMTMAASNGIAFVSEALAAAKSTGYLPDQSALSDAVSAARSGLVSSNFSSSYDMRLAQMKLAADLQGLMDITGDRKTIAEQQLEVAEAQLAAIEAQTEVVKAYYAAQLSGATSVRGYASGGNYPGGLAMVGERGPELINFRSPGTVYTASQTQRMLSGGTDTAEEVRQLREDSRAQARALVSMQAQMVKYFQRWDSDGLPETRVVTA